MICATMKASMPEQSYQNHTRRIPGLMTVLVLLLMTVVGACVNLYLSLGDHQRLYSASLILVLSLCVVPVSLYGRTSTLKVQDRAIRAEENLRHFAMTGKLMDARLDPAQIAALRFASDAEFVDLAKRAAGESMKPDEIKRAIRDWRADHHRA